jgi:hypothetical protein
MEGYWLSKRCTPAQATTIMRWMAMSVVKAQATDRQFHYAAIQTNMQAAMRRAGMKEDEAQRCVTHNMRDIQAFVSELEAKLFDGAKAA